MSNIIRNKQLIPTKYACEEVGIENEIYHFWDQKILIMEWSRIKAPPQGSITKIANPCTGIAYFIVENKKELIELYFKCIQNKQHNYENKIRFIIEKAANRKQSNSKIKHEGEYLNEHTIQQDFQNIWSNSKYCEYQIFSTLDHEKCYLEIKTILFELHMEDYLIINRSLETFVLFKLEFKSKLYFLVCDTHHAFHGLISYSNVLLYILLNFMFQGCLELVYPSYVNHRKYNEHDNVDIILNFCIDYIDTFN
eukprot:553088_1